MMFAHKKIPDVPRPELLDDREGHWYRAESGKVYPSVTTMLNGIDRRLWYYGWVQSIADREDTTFAEAEGIAKGISESSMRVGTRMHRFCEDWLNNRDRGDMWQEYDLEDAEYEYDPLRLFRPVSRWLDAHVDNVRMVEGRMFSERLGLAGTADFVAEIDGVLGVGDFKNFRRKKSPSDAKKYLIQGTAYATMFEEITGEEVKKVSVICSVWGEKKLQVFEADPADHRAELYDCIARFESKA